MSHPALRGAPVFAAPTALRERVGPRTGRVDLEALARAEAALAAMSSNFALWLQADVDKLDACREAIRSDGLDAKRLDRLFACAHDLKGLGSTYEFPLVTRMACSLCKLLGDGESRLRTPLALIDAHVSAIKAAVRGNIRDSDNPVGSALAIELERHTSEFLKSQG